jgi:hypothetical protein
MLKKSEKSKTQIELPSTQWDPITKVVLFVESDTLFPVLKDKLIWAFLEIQYTVSFLVMGQHVIKSVAHLIGALLYLELLPVDLILDVIDTMIQLGDVHFPVLEPVNSSSNIVFSTK